jgi:hypothetical protein
MSSGSFTPDGVHHRLDQQSRSLLVGLERTRDKLEIAKKDWANSYLHITEEDYEAILARKQELSAFALFNLSEKLWINPSDLESGTIDLDSLVQVQKGQKNYVHPRYTVAAKSRKHTVLNSLSFVGRHRGFHLRTVVNRHFQIHDDFWSTGLMDPINIQFVSDLMRFLRSRGLTDNEFLGMGMNSFSILKDTEVGNRFSRTRSLPEIYETLIYELIRHYDGNCRYRISNLTEDGCIIESVSDEDVASALEVPNTGCEEICLFRAGVFTSLPNYIGIREASVHQTRCVHWGDSHCRFVVDFSSHRIRDTGVRLSQVV